MIINIMSLESNTRFSSFYAFLCVSVLFMGSLCANAQSLRIVDCQGKTRAIKDVPSAEPTDVEVKVHSKDIRSAKLINNENTVIDGSLDGDIITFPSVPTGIWVLTTDSTEAFFSEISFEPTKAFFWSDVGEVALIAAGVVGAVFIAGAIDGNSGGGSGGNSGGGSNGGCISCNPNQDAPSIAPFSSFR